jgi:hypothetical protein
MADHAVNNTLEPIMEVLSAEGITVRRTRLLEQRIHAGRIAVAHLILAYALETDHPERAEEARREVRGFCSIAAFLSDEWSLDFIDDERHEKLRENFRKLGHQAGKLGLTHLPSPTFDEILDKLFDEYFWAA